MKNLLLVICLGVAGLWPAWAQSPSAPPARTDLAKDVYVESSPSDFRLEMTAAASPSSQVKAYLLTVAEKGEYKLLSFVDGKMMRLESVKLPGEFKLSIRGLVPGKHRLTLQAITADGRLGCASQSIQIEP
jgi:hypothetical protein